MIENELPSPVVKANASNVKLLPFSFPLHEKNDDEDDSIGPDNGESGKGEKAINRQQKRQAGYPNYLKEFQDKIEDNMTMTVKLWKAISEGTELVIDTREIFTR